MVLWARAAARRRRAYNVVRRMEPIVYRCVRLTRVRAVRGDLVEPAGGQVEALAGGERYLGSGCDSGESWVGALEELCR